MNAKKYSVTMMIAMAMGIKENVLEQVIQVDYPESLISDVEIFCITASFLRNYDFKEHLKNYRNHLQITMSLGTDFSFNSTLSPNLRAGSFDCNENWF